MANEVLHGPCAEGVGKDIFCEYQKRIDDERDRISHRLGNLETKVEQISELTTSVQELAFSVKAMAETQREQNERLKTIEDRDGEMWRKVLGQTVICIVAGVVGFILAKAGLVI